MKNIKDNILQEQETEELLYKVMPRVRPIPKDKYVAQNVIKKVLNDNPNWAWEIENNINLDEDIPVTEAYDRLRFFEYGITFIKNKSNRGDNFEGLLAGVCDGEVINDTSKPKEE